MARTPVIRTDCVVVEGGHLPANSSRRFVLDTAKVLWDGGDMQFFVCEMGSGLFKKFIGGADMVTHMTKLRNRKVTTLMAEASHTDAVANDPFAEVPEEAPPHGKLREKKENSLTASRKW